MKADVATTESAKQDDRTIPNGYFLGSASTHSLENITKSNSAMVNSSIELARETLEFSKTRLQANLDAWMVLSKYRNLSDLSKCHVELAKKATAQYTEAVSTILNRCANLVSTISAPGREQSRSL
jgi:hypothetical protein